MCELAEERLEGGASQNTASTLEPGRGWVQLTPEFGRASFHANPVEGQSMCSLCVN